MVVFSSRLAPPLVPCSHHPNWIPQLQVSHLRRHISSRACILLVSFDVQSCFLPCIGGHCSAYLWRCCCSSELILQFSSINLSFGIHIPKKYTCLWFKFLLLKKTPVTLEMLNRYAFGAAKKCQLSNSCR